MKEAGGKYSLSVISANGYDAAKDEVVLLDGTRQSPETLATSMIAGAGYLIQQRLHQAPALAALFGPRLWSVRVLVLLAETGPSIHRAVAKIATGTNPADNYWRSGNLLGAIELQSGTIVRVVSGTGARLCVNPTHPDTQNPIRGTKIPDWERLQQVISAAAPVFAGIRTQSWDVALTEAGPVPLELNFGGDLNLTQIAANAGILDAAYAHHLEDHGLLRR
jgi:hypothetical protein